MDLKKDYAGALEYEKSELQNIDLLKFLFAKHFQNRGKVRQAFLNQVSEKFEQLGFVFIHKRHSSKTFESTKHSFKRQ